MYGFPGIPNYLRLFVGLFSVYYFFMFGSAYRSVKGKNIISKLKKREVYRELTLFLLTLIILVYVGSLYRYLVEFGLWEIMDNAIHAWATG